MRVTGQHLTKQTGATLVYDYLQAWIDKSQNDYSVSSIDHFRGYLENHVKPAIGAVKVGDLDVDHLESFYYVLQNNGLSAQTIRHIHNMMSKAFGEMTRRGKLLTNPISQAKAPKLQPVRHNETWTADELEIFLKVAKKSRWYVAFLVAIYTGARRGEVLALRWKDIDFERGMISIVQAISKARKGFEVGRTKTDQSMRQMSVPAKLLNSLTLLRDQQHPQDARTFNRPSDYLVHTHEGNFVGPRNFDREWKKLLKESGLPKIRFQDLRHTHATLLLQSGINVKAVSTRLGHSTTQVTLGTYAHVTPRMEEGIVEVLNGMPLLT
nr:site-specific integrase [Saccharibacillus qingshengii]